MIQRSRRRTLSGRLGAFLAGGLCLAALTTPTWASPGELDSNFGNGGMIATPFPPRSPGEASAAATLLQPDGKIVLVGTSGSQFALARYTPDGSLDTSFGEAGRVVSELGGNDRATAAVLQPDGKIVVAGSSGDRLALARYSPDGSLDLSFGDGGTVISPLSAATDWIALRADGKILVAGGSASVVDEACRFTLARYAGDGVLDPSFGGGGEVVTKLGCGGVVAAQAVGGTVVAGPRAATGSGANRLVLARYGLDGSPDTSFGDQGQAISGLGGGFVASTATVEPDGAIALGASSSDRVALTRYIQDGSLDSSFGDGGKVVTSRRDHVRPEALLVQRDGKILVAGTARVPPSRLNRFAVARYRADGSLDRSFGDRGRTISKPGTGTSAALQADGKIIVAGSASRVENGLGRREFALLRFDGGGRSPAGPPAASATQTRHQRLKAQGAHRPRPPRAVPAFYINAHNFRELKRFAATDTCAFARTQPRKAHRTLILDFGGARAYGGGSYGAALNHEAFKATNRQIRIALTVAADAYASCHRRGQARIVYANTNHFETQRSALLARRIGVHQARTVRHVRAYQRRRGYSPAERAGVAGDIETGYWGPKRSKDMVNGAKSVWQRGYVDFGTAGGCPPHPKGLHLRGCFNDWRLRDVAHVSHAGDGAPVPEIYYLGGPRHFDQAAQWANVARSWNARHRSRYGFFGATGSTEFSKLTPRESWKRLRAKAPGRVRRELLNFKQDQTLRTSAKGARGTNAPNP